MNNIFYNNDAQYGKDYASYPYQLKMMSEIKNKLIPVSSSAGLKQIII
jgi:hypothetical protein